MKTKASRKTITISWLIIIGIVLTTILMFYMREKFEAPSVKIIATEQSKQIAPKEQSEVIKEEPEIEKKLSIRPLGKVVYLTFDDGPSQLTGQFLDVLKEHDVKATFFMQGANLQNKNFQDNVRRATSEGHYVGAHSMTHNSKRLYTDGKFVEEMNETIAIIHDITGENPKLVRAPYGSVPGLDNEQLRNQIAKANIKIWDWTVDSLDWKLKNNPYQIVENIKNGTSRDIEVVLMHEVRQTLQVLPNIISFYKERGYKFGVYNDLLHFPLNFHNDERL
ncbi:peptidoglycan N-acetylglucosamine deacetylase [Lysinibacillus xylanilyticus]|uniref:Peptidoglycan N-acetylglucosamine deacetylase n=1 Tax=Lysinibacillus xylanilyticus TaxID=582475 RepID=A0A0K9F9U9_9BACI|nr:polysaccharide deacetylase family protein [Lysinibacillus xylanilyticus]KMY31394.1 peptidoglycan N-acetylglucosamine deacetylase [Lysinibacillus xylanilyticus]